MTQETSWTNIHGTEQYPGLVGQVFFATDSDTLDSQDRNILRQLVRAYGPHLLGRRVELMCIGNADRRGGRRYNLQLGQRRAEAVQRYFNQQLGDRPLFSCHRALSHGERNAAQNAPSAARMAEDRRVDIFSSFIPERRIVLPPIRITAAPPVQRCVHREYASTTELSGSALDIMGGNPGDAAFDNFLRGIIGLVQGAGAAPSLGNEIAGRRRYVQKPTDQRVNRIRIEQEERYSPPRYAGPSILASHSVVHYTWGAPSQTVEVVLNRTYTDGLSGRETRSTNTRRVQRASVAGNPFFFPPDPPAQR
jgi:hypothetical protein